jgi:hypothetical protein
MSQTTPQLDLFAAHPVPAPDYSFAGYAATMPAVVRPRLQALLAELQSAARNPWNTQRTGVHCILFQQMTNWLPAEERDELRAAFGAQLERLGIAA